MSAPSESSYVALRDGRKLFYDLSGPADAPIVLLSNSLLTNYTVWDPFAKVLHGKGFRVLRYNQSGHGKSSPPSDLESTTFLTLSVDVAELVKALNVKALHAWIGDSMGAVTGVIFVTQNPGVVKKLVLCDTITMSPSNGGVEDPFGPRVEEARGEHGILTLTGQTLERWFSPEWQEANPEELSRMRGLMLTTSPEGFITGCNALRHDSFDLRPYLERIASSVEAAKVIVGERDADLPNSMAEMRDQMQKGFGSKSVVGWAVIKDAGHLPFIDQPEQFADEVLTFLDGRTAS